MRVLISEDQIQARIRELGAQIDADYPEGPICLIAILKGACFFLADLARAVKRPARIDFIGISSYGQGRTSSGEVKLTKDLDVSIEGADVLVVEDIVDSGVTLNYLMHVLEQRKPRTLRVAALLDKPGRRPAGGGELRWLSDPGRIRGRLRAGLRRRLPQPAGYLRLHSWSRQGELVIQFDSASDPALFESTLEFAERPGEAPGRAAPGLLSDVHPPGALEARPSRLDALVRRLSARHDVDLPGAAGPEQRRGQYWLDQAIRYSCRWSQASSTGRFTISASFSCRPITAGSSSLATAVRETCSSRPAAQCPSAFARRASTCDRSSRKTPCSSTS